MRIIDLVLPNRNTKVGEINDDVAYILVGPKNFLGLAKGYSVDEEVFKSIKKAGCKWLDFLAKSSLKRYRIEVEEFDLISRVWDFGYGRKLAAPLSFFKEIPLQGSANA